MQIINSIKSIMSIKAAFRLFIKRKILRRHRSTSMIEEHFVAIIAL